MVLAVDDSGERLRGVGALFPRGGWDQYCRARAAAWPRHACIGLPQQLAAGQPCRAGPPSCRTRCNPASSTPRPMPVHQRLRRRRAAGRSSTSGGQGTRSTCCASFPCCPTGAVVPAAPAATLLPACGTNSWARTWRCCPWQPRCRSAPLPPALLAMRTHQQLGWGQARAAGTHLLTRTTVLGRLAPAANPAAPATAGLCWTAWCFTSPLM